MCSNRYCLHSSDRPVGKISEGKLSELIQVRGLIMVSAFSLDRQIHEQRQSKDDPFQIGSDGKKLFVVSSGKMKTEILPNCSNENDLRDCSSSLPMT